MEKRTPIFSPRQLQPALLLLLVLPVLLGLAGCGGTVENSLPEGVGETPAKGVGEALIEGVEAPASYGQLSLTIGSAPGPVTYPLAIMHEKNPNIVLNPWQGGEKLTAMITSKEVDLCSTPISNALLTYNKGMDTQLLMVTVWGMLYVMSTENDIVCMEDLKGKEVIVSGKGGIQDLIFRHLLIKNDLDPNKDLTITYLDMMEASQRLISGQIKHAVLNEPQASIATLNMEKENLELRRVLDLTEEWNKLPGQEGRGFPMAGIIVVGGSGASPEQIETFARGYIQEAAWIDTHGPEAGVLVEKHIPTMKAMAVSQSIGYARLDPRPAQECKEEIISFFKELTTTADMRAIGGKLPDDDFFYR
ncbi:MAG: ABC transporter substrate-binding protein [Dethiobacteria bacterium]